MARDTMMPTQKHEAWFPMAALGVLLACALAFFYAKTRDYDPSGYFENVALLRQIKQLDAHWELDTMKSKIGINQTYDPLVDPLLDFHHLQQQLDALTPEQGPGSASPLAEEVKAFEMSLQQKARLVEHFKTHNAVLRNSLAYLPTAAEDIQNSVAQNVGGDPAQLRRVAMGVNKLLLASLVYDQTASRDKVEEIESELRALIAPGRHLPPEIADRIGIFIPHVRAVLREHETVSNLLNKIAAEPTATRVDAINQTLNAEQRLRTEQADTYRRYLLMFAAALIALFLYAAVRLIRSHVTINRINTELQHANGNLEQRVQERTQELQAVQAELVTAARQAGMAEIATNVLHNVGNVLNSVNVSAGLASDRVRASKTQGLSKAVQLMNDHAENLGAFFTLDPKGRMLPAYLNKLSEALVAEHNTISEELAQLTKNVDHIKEIVSTQQSYAGATNVFEQLQVSDLIEDALRMSADSLAHHHIAVAREFTEVPPLPLDRHRVLQILVNLISNAKNALTAVPEHQHQITIRLHKTTAPSVKIQVEDNGEGIPPENLTRIFAHGFTTRKEGHGFGLHSCVLASHEMGGSLTVNSAGWGQGATFTLELPIKIEIDQEVS